MVYAGGVWYPAFYLLPTDYCLLFRPIAGQVIQVDASRAGVLCARRIMNDEV